MDIKVKGQVTIWIIWALILVGVIVLFLFLQQEITTEVSGSGTEVGSFIGRCMEPSVREAEDIMLPRGGLLEKQNTVLFNFQEVEYLCVNMGFYEPCINQHPLLIREMEDELKEYLKPRVDICFNELKEYIEDRGEKFTFSQDYDFEVSVVPEKIVLDINRNTRYITKTGDENALEEYRAEFPSGAHGLATVALEIAAQEATYCYFESTGYSLYYPRYKISRHQLSYPVKIYTINDTMTNEYMMIAIRSCAMPAGV
ncbi:hypothetical protein J4233_03885 [Candidatus Pacearchaeota archaeon]|nr:hypothetical protein [Candidatus Pacearchaeota archaeon]